MCVERFDSQPTLFFNFNLRVNKFGGMYMWASKTPHSIAGYYLHFGLFFPSFFLSRHVFFLPLSHLPPSLYLSFFSFSAFVGMKTSFSEVKHADIGITQKKEKPSQLGFS